MAIIQSISAAEFKQRLEDGGYEIIDVRTPLEWEMEGRVDGAVLMNIQEPDFMEKIKDLDRDKKYLIYCRSGGRSKYALNFMEQLGFQEVYELDMGIQSL